MTIPEFSLRPATEADSALLLSLRNDPLTRANSLNTELIHETTHAKWLAATLRDLSTRLYIFERDGVAVGMGRLTRGPQAHVDVSLALLPEVRGHGYATIVIEMLLKVATGWTVTTAHAICRADNIPSLRAFLSQGFSLEQSIVLLRKELP